MMQIFANIFTKQMTKNVCEHMGEQRRRYLRKDCTYIGEHAAETNGENIGEHTDDNICEHIGEHIGKHIGESNVENLGEQNQRSIREYC